MAVLGLSAPAAAQCTFTATANLTDTGGFLWDIQRNGTVSNGTSDAYDVGLSLFIDDVAFPDATTAPATELAGRQLVTGPATMSGLTVTRRAYVPDTGTAFARFYDELVNSSGAPITVSVSIRNNPGSDTGTSTIASSSGDNIYALGDRWVTSDDGDGTGDPSLCHSFAGADAAVVADAVSTTVFDCAAPNGYSATYTVTVPAGSTVSILTFAAQAPNRAAAAATCGALDLVPAEALAGLTSAQQLSVVNWRLIRLADGEECADDRECSSDFCVDGVCCDTACGGGDANDCQACAVGAGAATDGVCGAASATTECRSSAGDCDAAELCDGTALTCPTDVAAAAGTECRAAADACDAIETCDGTAIDCPADAVAAAGTECRASAGDCDVAEACDGTAISCPADAVAAAGTECRADAGDCDVPEACDGTDVACPADAFEADGASCTDMATCTDMDTCNAGACMPGPGLDCDDSNVCTADMCMEVDGCMNVAIADCCTADTECDDGDACTTDTCSSTTNRCETTPIPGCGVVDSGTPMPDGGMSGGDAGVGSDAGTTPPSSGGCSCSVPVQSRANPGYALFGLVAALAVFARRRRR